MYINTARKDVRVLFVLSYNVCAIVERLLTGSSIHPRKIVRFHIFMSSLPFYNNGIVGFLRYYSNEKTNEQ